MAQTGHEVFHITTKAVRKLVKGVSSLFLPSKSRDTPPLPLAHARRSPKRGISVGLPFGHGCSGGCECCGNSSILDEG